MEYKVKSLTDTGIASHIAYNYNCVILVVIVALISVSREIFKGEN